MEYNKYFIFIVISGSLFGIFFGIFTNDLIIDNEKSINIKKNTNNSDINIDNEEQIQENDEQKENEKEKVNSDSIKEEENINKDSTIEEEIKKEQVKQNKTIIAVSYATDNKYIYPTIVSMTSLVLNACKDTLYDIYILHTPDFTEKSKNILNKFKNKFKDRCKITYINMGDRYKNLKYKRRLSISTYYRLSLHDILPKINKIIYLDGDI